MNEGKLDNSLKREGICGTGVVVFTGVDSATGEGLNNQKGKGKKQFRREGRRVTFKEAKDIAAFQCRQRRERDSVVLPKMRGGGYIIRETHQVK